MSAYKRPTAKQFVRALNSTSARYFSRFISRATFDRHMRSIWGQIEQTKQMTSRVRALLAAQNAASVARWEGGGK